MAARQNLSVPLICKVEGGRLEPGKSFVFRGLALDLDEDKKVDEWTLQFRLGPDEDADVAFQLAVTAKKVLLNARKDGEWGEEEKAKQLFKAEQPFKLSVRCQHDHFELHLDQKDYVKFDYRLPLSAITHVAVNGRVQLTGLSLQGGFYSVPFEKPLSNFHGGKRLYISGEVDDKADRFSVNLHNRNGDIVFHFAPRFGENAVVRNAQINGEWGTEEREGKMPFSKRDTFDLVIDNEPYSIQILVNGKFFCAFSHRSDPDDIHKLSIDGDIELQAVNIQ